MTRTSMWTGVAAFLLLMSLAFHPASAASIPYTNETVKGLSKAYGFVIGQEYTLQRIEKAYPAMAGDVELARMTFATKFPDLKKKLEAELRAAMKDQYSAYLDEMRNKMPTLLAKQQLTPQTARDFLATFAARAKGDQIDPEVLRYILAVQYAKNPAREFAEGFQQRFRTDGSGKSRGVRLSLRLPRSWVAKDGERPHIVQKWVAVGGTGNGMYMLIVNDSGVDVEPTHKEIEDLIRTGEVKDFLPEGSTMKASGVTKLEQRTVLWIDAIYRAERLDNVMHQRGTIHYLWIKDKIVALSCQAGFIENTAAQADAAYAEIKPLCNQILNSLVLEQAY